MTSTARVGLHEILPGRSGQDVGVVELTRQLDALTFPFVKDRDLTAPPGSPVNGDAYIPAATATGAWAAWEQRIAYYYDGWKSLVPKENYTAWLDDENVVVRFDGAAWRVESRPFWPTVLAKTASFSADPRLGVCYLCDATAGAIVATPVSAVRLTGARLELIKVDAGVNDVDWSVGGLATLSTQYDRSVVMSNGTTWIPVKGSL